MTYTPFWPFKCHFSYSIGHLQPFLCSINFECYHCCHNDSILRCVAAILLIPKNVISCRRIHRQPVLQDSGTPTACWRPQFLSFTPMGTKPFNRNPTQTWTICNKYVDRWKNLWVICARFAFFRILSKQTAFWHICPSIYRISDESYVRGSSSEFFPELTNWRSLYAIIRWPHSLLHPSRWAIAFSRNDKASVFASPSLFWGYVPLSCTMSKCLMDGALPSASFISQIETQASTRTDWPLAWHKVGLKIISFKI